MASQLKLSKLASLTPSELTEFLRSLPEADKREIDKILLETGQTWVPQVGAQTDALLTEADELYYGGQAGGGKTDLLIGAAISSHRRSIIFRREYRQLRSIVERTHQIIGHRRGFNGQLFTWRAPDDRFAPDWLLELGACQHLGDEQGHQGHAHDLKGFDELPHFLEAQYVFLCGWNRSTDPNQRTRIIATGNPPTGVEGEWVTTRWGPWLDDQHPDPAKPGELRWFARLDDGEEIQCEDGSTFDHKGETIIPKSRTFIPSGLEDNIYYGAAYRATLQALPEPLRSQLLQGDFTAGKGDNPWQVIPTEWVALAQERWVTSTKPDVAMSSMGVDVARGGKAETVLSPRWRWWFGEQIVQPGKDTPDGPAVAALVAMHLRDEAIVNLDIIGVGGSVQDHLLENGIAVAALGSSNATKATDRSGKLGFLNKRAEWWWKLREALDPELGEDLALPPCRKLRADLCAPRWRLSSRGIQIWSKDDIIDRLGRSPDRGDSAVYAFAESGMDGLTEANFETGEEMISSNPAWRY